jgi:hypothetical protein
MEAALGAMVLEETDGAHERAKIMRWFLGVKQGNEYVPVRWALEEIVRNSQRDGHGRRVIICARSIDDTIVMSPEKHGRLGTIAARGDTDQVMKLEARPIRQVEGITLRGYQAQRRHPLLQMPAGLIVARSADAPPGRCGQGGDLSLQLF